jgi:hypothetical protein
VLELSVPVDCVPLRDFVPVQPPLAVHDVVLDEDQDSVDALPAAIAPGLALMVTTGAAADTVTVVAWVALPPGPVQVRV